MPALRLGACNDESVKFPPHLAPTLFPHSCGSIVVLSHTLAQPHPDFRLKCWYEEQWRHGLDGGREKPNGTHDPCDLIGVFGGLINRPLTLFHINSDVTGALFGGFAAKERPSFIFIELFLVFGFGACIAPLDHYDTSPLPKNGSPF